MKNKSRSLRVQALWLFTVFCTASAFAEGDSAATDVASKPAEQAPAASTNDTKEVASPQPAAEPASKPVETPQAVPDQPVAPTAAAAPSPSEVADKAKALSAAKTISPGDLISVTVREDRDGPQVMLVDEQGMIALPYLGAVVAKGKTFTQLADEIRTALEKSYYEKATVTVTPASQEGTRGRIFVLGQVATPGPVKIPTDEILTASRAILQAGATSGADLTRVSIVRKDPKNPGKDMKMDVNVSEVINNGRFDQDVIVRANDMIFVPGKGESIGQILMSGAIRQPGPMEIPIGGRFTVTDAIFRAGGFADFADKERVKIIRRDPTDDQKQKTIIVNVQSIMDKGKLNLDQALQNDDVIIVPEKWFNF